MRTRSALGRLWMALCAVACALPAPGEAQESRDTATVDSTAIRLRERLRVLSLPPGDSSQAQPSDSLQALSGFRLLPGAERGGADDDLVAALRALPGYAPAEYRGLSAEYRAAEGVLVLHGDSTRPAALEREGSRLEADSTIRYLEESGTVDARGNPVYVPLDGDQVQSRALYCDLNGEQCAALGARTEYDEGAKWIVTGDLPVVRPELAYGHKTRFTSCELEEPHYHFETDQLKIVRGSILVARPVRLYFGDVPVAWLPFVAQSLASGRASGLLTPRFSVNDIVRTSGGYRRRISNVGFYWAMSDYTDAIVAFDWFDDNYTALTGNFQYRWLRQFLDGSVSLRRFWRAEGGTELTLNTRHNWEASERTRLTLTGSYASSSSFVTRNTFNPLELTRSIDSNGGFSRRFDWGTVNVAANRRQFLSDDKVEMTLPDVSVSLKTVTLFAAPANRASWFNNLTWSGGGNVRRSIRDFAEGDAQNDQGTLSGGANTSLNLGALTLSGNVSYAETTVKDLFRDSLPFFPALLAERGMSAFASAEGRAALNGERVDVAAATLDWGSTISYQQNLIGSTTITPRITFSGSARRADTVAVAQSLVSAPTRTSFGAVLKSDVYGFFPGFGGFERIRHKISPQFSYDWSPETQPTELQKDVFGSRALQATNVVSVTLNQTFEARRPANEPDVGPDAAPAAGPGGVQAAPTPTGAARDGYRRLPTGTTVTLLALRTSAVEYDFVQADSTGRFVDGFTRTELSNSISSDYLRGLSIQFTHDLFAEPEDVGGPANPLDPGVRTFDPHLSRLNLGFSLNNNSTLVRWLGLGGDDGGTRARAAAPGADPAADPSVDPQGGVTGGVTDDASMIPGTRESRRGRQSPSASRVGEWSANFSYSLTRPREGAGGTALPASQMIQSTFRLQPTEKWEMSWQTGYDLENSQFTDHVIRLTRDLHRWQANFDFLQTATGNWTFRFEVTLLDNEDLKFDYEQRNLDRIGTTPVSGGN